MLIFPFAVIIQTIIFWAISGNGSFTLYYLASIPVSAIIAYNWRRYFMSAMQYLKVARLHMTKPDLIVQLKKLNGLIYNKVKEVM
jgi:hypothetical protein